MSGDHRYHVVEAPDIPTTLVGGKYTGVCPDVLCDHIRNAKWGSEASMIQLRNLLHLAANTMPDGDVLEVATFIHRAGQTLLWRNPPARSKRAPE